VSVQGEIATAGFSVSGSAVLNFYKEPSGSLLMSPIVALYPRKAYADRLSPLDSASVIQIRMEREGDAQAMAVAFRIGVQDPAGSRIAVVVAYTDKKFIQAQKMSQSRIILFDHEMSVLRQIPIVEHQYSEQIDSYSLLHYHDGTKERILLSSYGKQTRANFSILCPDYYDSQCTEQKMSVNNDMHFFAKDMLLTPEKPVVLLSGHRIEYKSDKVTKENHYPYIMSVELTTDWTVHNA
jgi:hypothetical protein